MAGSRPTPEVRHDSLGEVTETRPEIVTSRHLICGDLIRIGGRRCMVVAYMNSHPNPAHRGMDLVVLMGADRHGNELFFEPADPVEDFCGLLDAGEGRVERARARWLERVPYSMEWLTDVREKGRG